MELDYPTQQPNASVTHTFDRDDKMPKRILIVDDSQETARTIKEALLRHIGASADIAYNGKEALQVLRRKDTQYDLVILEVLVPKLNGVDVCEAMAQDPSLKKIPVLLTSILPLRSEAFQKSLKKYGRFSVVCDTLEKPFSVEALCAKIQEAACRAPLIY